MIKVLIADDHPLVREGLKKTLKEESGMKVCFEAENAERVFQYLRDHEADVVVTDLSMPGRSGLEMLGELKRLYPKLPVLILSMHPEERFAVRAIKLGAAGYLTKEGAPYELVKAIRKIVAGGRYITPGVAEKLALAIDVSTEKPLHKTLSDREFQLLGLIASGKSIQEIADELSLGTTTVRNYRARVLEKMDMKTDVELTQYALRNHLIE